MRAPNLGMYARRKSVPQTGPASEHRQHTFSLVHFRLLNLIRSLGNTPPQIP